MANYSLEMSSVAQHLNIWGNESSPYTYGQMIYHLKYSQLAGSLKFCL